MNKILLAQLCLLAFTGTAFAQEDSAPQEAPYIQEDNEFDAFSNDSSPILEENDAANVEAEIQDPNKKEAVNLNEKSDKKIEEDLLLEEDMNQIAEPSAPLPYQPPATEQQVQPTQKMPRTSRTTKSSKGGVEYIEHPQAKKGLMMITKEGAYVYRTEEKQKYEKTGTFRIGMMDPPKIKAADGTTFSQMYSPDQQALISFDLEWQPFQGFGTLGVQSGLGLMYASGNGRFLDGSGAAKEKYTFLAIPLNLGLVYRLEYMHRQWMAPYVNGGGTYVGVAEIRDDGKAPKLVGTPGAYGGGGLMFNISAISRDTGFTLQSEYGIKNMWVTLDYKYLATFNEDLDFSSSIIGGGISCDY